MKCIQTILAVKLHLNTFSELAVIAGYLIIVVEIEISLLGEVNVLQLKAEPPIDPPLLSACSSNASRCTLKY